MQVPLDRKTFLREGAMMIGGACLLPVAGLAAPDKLQQDFVITVTGKIPARNLAFTLAHEHVMVDFIGAASVTPERYQPEQVFGIVLPYLRAVKQAGCNTIAECTPAWLARDVRLLKRLSVATGLNILTNTGYYGASKEKFLPQHAYTETAEQLAARWISEFENGIEGSGIKPGFIKTGVDAAPLTSVQQKLVKAAALTHLATGLAIFIHTNGGEAALEEMKILRDNGVEPSAWNWVHAQAEKDRKYHRLVAKAGGWVSFDSFNKNDLQAYIDFLKDLKADGLLRQVVLSQDAGWYHVGETNGGEFRGYTAIQELLLPAMRANQFSEADIRQVFYQNPARLFTIRKRPLKAGG